MHCLLVAATAAEITPFTEHLASTEKLEFIDFDIDILITGIGVLSASYTLSRYLQHKRPDLVIQAGVAGTFDPGVPLGAVYAVKSDTLADLGVQEKSGFKTIFDLGLASANDTPYKKGLLPNPHTNLVRQSRLKKATAITVNEISTAPKKIKEIESLYSPTLETMEGAALHFVCLQENIPFLQIRSVSNLVGVRDKKKWKLPLAIENLNRELIRLLETL